MLYEAETITAAERQFICEYVATANSKTVPQMHLSCDDVKFEYCTKKGALFEGFKTFASKCRRLPIQQDYPLGENEIRCFLMSTFQSKFFSARATRTRQKNAIAMDTIGQPTPADFQSPQRGDSVARSHAADPASKLGRAKVARRLSFPHTTPPPPQHVGETEGQPAHEVEDLSESDKDWDAFLQNL